jgi:hypothetical protein
VTMSAFAEFFSGVHQDLLGQRRLHVETADAIGADEAAFNVIQVLSAVVVRVGRVARAECEVADQRRARVHQRRRTARRSYRADLIAGGVVDGLCFRGRRRDKTEPQ